MNARATHTRHCLPPAVAASPVARVSVSQMTRPNGITTTWSYETNRDLITRVQNGTISAYGYVNDAVGRRTSMSRSGSAYANPDTISYTYNDRSELTGASSNVDTTYSYSYAYDPIGNRVTASEAGVPWTFTANSLNQYTSATENNTQLSFSYDLDGSMTYRPVDATSGWTQVWNGENRMVETYRGNNRLTFKYDYLGRRVEKCVYSGNTLTSKTCFVYDGFKCVEELDGLNGNSVLMRHTWQPFDVGLDVILATTDGNGTSYFLHDANKNVMQKANLVGVALGKYTYAPFGGNAGTDRAHIGFSSEVAENDMEMVYYNYRYLLTQLGRFGRRDPVGETQGGNMMALMYNNTITAFDFLGLACCGSEYYSPLLFGCCDLGRRKHVYSRLTDCCVKGEDVYGREESWPVKICFGNMGVGPIPHVWVEFGKFNRGFSSNDEWITSPVLDSGKWEDNSGYSKRIERFFFFSYYFNENVKYCIPIHLSKCRFDVAKFDSCLKDERPMAMYSALAEIETIINPSFPDKIGMYLAIGLPDFLDILSVPFNLSPIKDCHTAAYAMIAKCARKAKR